MKIIHKLGGHVLVIVKQYYFRFYQYYYFNQTFFKSALLQKILFLTFWPKMFMNPC